MNNAPTYTLCISPRFEGVFPRFDFFVRQSVPAGIDGPFTEMMTVETLDAVDAWLGKNEFFRTTEFGEVCGNGFATATVVRR